jgi:hypothetical protein
MLDPSSGWFEVNYVTYKSAKESTNTFDDDVWLSITQGLNTWVSTMEENKSKNLKN